MSVKKGELPHVIKHHDKYKFYSEIVGSMNPMENISWDKLGS